MHLDGSGVFSRVWLIDRYVVVVDKGSCSETVVMREKEGFVAEEREHFMCSEQWFDKPVRQHHPT